MSAEAVAALESWRRLFRLAVEDASAGSAPVGGWSRHSLSASRASVGRLDEAIVQEAGAGLFDVLEHG